jgi:hypothetical protein
MMLHLHPLSETRIFTATVSVWRAVATLVRVALIGGEAKGGVPGEDAQWEILKAL